jgi:hypothetical protein
VQEVFARTHSEAGLIDNVHQEMLARRESCASLAEAHDGRAVMLTRLLPYVRYCTDFACTLRYGE